LTARFEEQDFIRTMGVVRQKALDAKIPCGLHIVTPSEDDLLNKIENGYRFIAYSIDAVFLNKNIKRPFL